MRRGLGLVVIAVLFFFIGAITMDDSPAGGIGSGFGAVGALALAVGLVMVAVDLFRS